MDLYCFVRCLEMQSPPAVRVSLCPCATIIPHPYPILPITCLATSDTTLTRCVNARYGRGRSQRSTCLDCEKLVAARGNKVCSKCGVEKDLLQFRLDSQKSSPLSRKSICKQCMQNYLYFRRNTVLEDRLQFSIVNMQTNASTRKLEVEDGMNITWALQQWQSQDGVCYWSMVAGSNIKLSLLSGDPHLVSFDRVHTAPPHYSTKNTKFVSHCMNGSMTWTVEKVVSVRALYYCDIHPTSCNFIL